MDIEDPNEVEGQFSKEDFNKENSYKHILGKIIGFADHPDFPQKGEKLVSTNRAFAVGYLENRIYRIETEIADLDQKNTKIKKVKEKIKF